MNWTILFLMKYVAGARFDIVGPGTIPEGKPVLLVSNHQSMYDIPMIMLMFPDREVGFVAKKELGKGIPSISLSLRKLGSVLIDRRDPKQALPAIERFGRDKNDRAEIACIFPEGTRARDGVMKAFRRGGFETMLRAMPDALVIPIAIDGNWEFLRYKLLPVPYAVRISCVVLDPVDQGQQTPEITMSQVENAIRRAINQDQPQINPPAGA